MNIAIYQIDPDRDENNVAFLNYENLERFQGSAAPRSEIYDKVFEGEVECGTLEEVYQMFNIGQPDGYRGRSLSVSDVVEVVGYVLQAISSISAEAIFLYSPANSNPRLMPPIPAHRSIVFKFIYLSP